MLEGRATIQLFNAETGEKEYEVTEKNIVTKAVENMMNPPFGAVIGMNYYVPNLLKRSSNPPYMGAYGGLFLWANEHDEDVENTYPNFDSVLVGYGSDETSVHDTFEGVRNTTESKEIEDGKGYRFVWDFTTSQANGTIKSVSLTSLAGGRRGYGKKNIESGAMVNRSFSGSNSWNHGNNAESGCIGYLAYNTGAGESQVGFEPLLERLGLISSSGIRDHHTANAIYISEVQEDGTFYILWAFIFDGKIVKMVFKDPKTLSMFKSPTNNLPEYVSHENFITGISRRSTVLVDNDKIHIIYPTQENNNSVQKLKHKWYNLQTGANEGEKDVTLPISNGSSAYGYLADLDKYYCFARTPSNWDDTHSTTFYVFGEDGTEDYHQDDLPSGYSSISYHLGNYDSGGYQMKVGLGKDPNTGIYYIVTGDGLLFPITKSGLQTGAIMMANKGTSGWLTCTTVNKYEKVQKGAMVIPICYGYYDNQNVGITYNYLPYYLGTINNLGTPITKTSAQSMKVIYEIVEKEE